MLASLITPANLHTAFRRVEASRGMAGVDMVTIGAYRRNLDLNMALLGEELRSGRYAPLPLLRLLVAKRDGSPRALAVPCVRDRVAQAAVLNLIEPIFEAHFEEVSFAYRKGRSVRQAAMRLRELRDQGYRFVVEADLDDYFDNIDHGLLLAKITAILTDPHLLRLLRLWVQAEVYDGEKIFVMKKGIPQGAVISPLLANLFLDELDETLSSRGYHLVRYADDFVILTKTRPEAEAALELTEEVLTRLHLSLDPEDTAITRFEAGFKFLGLIFLKDSILAPFDRPKREKRVLYFPPPFDLAAYLASRKPPPGE
ncbi:MAG: RNA-directed DNA polymerase [Deltaproteobacteria bacterium]|nr:RNA-directed DNA polymerase [Deltaproteobacteria bacterium]